MEQRLRCAASLVTPRTRHWQAEKRRRELRLVCRGWRAEVDRLAGNWGVVTNTSAATCANMRRLRMARFHQSQGWKGAEKKLLQTILVITKTSVQLAVLEVVLCPGLVAQLIEAVASWGHAVCLQSLSFNTTFQPSDPQNTTPLHLLQIISTAFFACRVHNQG